MMLIHGQENTNIAVIDFINVGIKDPIHSYSSFLFLLFLNYLLYYN